MEEGYRRRQKRRQEEKDVLFQSPRIPESSRQDVLRRIFQCEESADEVIQERYIVKAIFFRNTNEL